MPLSDASVSLLWSGHVREKKRKLILLFFRESDGGKCYVFEFVL